MALIATRKGPAVGLQLEWSPDGFVCLSVHTAAGHLTAHLTAAEAHQTLQTLRSILNSHREPAPSPAAFQASPDPSRLPR